MSGKHINDALTPVSGSPAESPPIIFLLLPGKTSCPGYRWKKKNRCADENANDQAGLLITLPIQISGDAG